MAGRMQPATSKCTISIAVEIRNTPENEVVLPGVDRCLCRGLSPMLLKAHVRILGGRTAAMRYGYPTKTTRQSSDARDPFLGSRLLPVPVSSFGGSKSIT